MSYGRYLSPACAEQLRESRGPVGLRRWKLSSSSIGPAAGPTRRSSRSTHSLQSWPSTRYRRFLHAIDRRQHVATFDGFRFAVFPRAGGRARTSTQACASGFGRFLGRIHAVGAHGLPTGRRSISRLSASSRGLSRRRLATGSNSSALRRRFAAGARPGSRPVRPRRASTRCDCTAIATKAMCCGPIRSTTWSALRRLRRQPHGASGAGLLDVARRRPCRADRELGGPARRLRRFCRVRSSRIGTDRATADAAAYCTTRLGSRAAGTTPRSPLRFRGSTRSAIGRIASSSSASKSQIPYNYTSFSDREIVIRLLGRRGVGSCSTSCAPSAAPAGRRACSTKCWATSGWWSAIRTCRTICSTTRAARGLLIEALRHRLGEIDKRRRRRAIEPSATRRSVELLCSPRARPWTTFAAISFAHRALRKRALRALLARTRARQRRASTAFARVARHRRDRLARRVSVRRAAPDTEEEMPGWCEACIELGLTIIPRGGGTGYTGGAVPLTPRSAVINTEKLERLGASSR